MPKRLVIFVEGKGDVKAMPMLAQRVVNEIGAYDIIFVDHEPFRVRSVAALVRDGCRDWHRWLSVARSTRPNLGGVLLVLDGDADRVPTTWKTHTTRFNTSDFCARNVATLLGEEARAARAGEAFSLATVFAVKEFETWLLAGIQSLRGVPLADGRGTVPLTAAFDSRVLEQIRGAKERLQTVIPAYDQSLDQAVLSQRVDLGSVREGSRSFRRFCNAIKELSDAVRESRPTVTPAPR